MSDNKRKKPPPLPDKVADLPGPKPITTALAVLAELDGIDTGLPSEELAWVQNCLDYLGHPDIAARLGTAADDLAAAIQCAYDVLEKQHE
jgi:hypothetical protein